MSHPPPIKIKAMIDFKKLIRDTFFVASNPTVSIFDQTDPPVVVLDGFYKDPERVKALASSLDYGLRSPPAEHKLYPGERAVLSLGLPDVEDRIISQYSSLVPEFTFLRCKRSSQPTVFTRMNDSTIAFSHPHQRVPHIDSDCDLVAVIYLGTSEHAQSSSTNFYKHRHTSISYLPRNPKPDLINRVFELGFNICTEDGYDDLVRYIMSSDRNVDHNSAITGLDSDTLEWSVLLRVQAQFNRCTIMPARLFHSPVYQANLQNCASADTRLTQNLFFSVD